MSRSHCICIKQLCGTNYAIVVLVLDGYPDMEKVGMVCNLEAFSGQAALELDVLDSPCVEEPTLFLAQLRNSNFQ
eukprot:5023677-Amphidinium_carterae.1